MAVTQENIDQFCLITGSHGELAKNLLEACGNSLEMAVNMHMENGESDPTSGPGAVHAPAAGTSGSFRPGPSTDPDDNVRAPIPQKQETLIEPGFEGYEMTNRLNRNSRSRVRSVFDGFRNFEEETLRRENEDVVEQPVIPAGVEVPLTHTQYNRSKKRTLEELFKPPLDIMYRGDWQSARDKATESGRWLLVNIQEPKEFQCQVLNRDLWSNPGVKTIISEHFVFWQQYKQSDEAQRYMTFYKITSWPYIAVIDPRTGENMVTWSHIDANAFPELITEFLSLNPNLETPEKEPPRKKQRQGDKDESNEADGASTVAEMDEEAQLAAAIKASLADTLTSNQQEPDMDLNLSDDEADSPMKRRPNDCPTTDSVGVTEPGAELRGEPLKPTSNGLTNGSVGEDSRQEDGSATTNGKTATWRTYLGQADDPLTNILIRYPDGSRDSWNYPSTSKLKALIEFISEKGYPLDDHEIVANFPRRIISQLDQDKTMKEHSLFPRETLFVQLKD